MKMMSSSMRGAFDAATRLPRACTAARIPAARLTPPIGFLMRAALPPGRLGGAPRGGRRVRRVIDVRVVVAARVQRGGGPAEAGELVGDGVGHLALAAAPRELERRLAFALAQLVDD